MNKAELLMLFKINKMIINQKINKKIIILLMKFLMTINNKILVVITKYKMFKQNI